MSVMLPAKHHLEFLRLKGGYTGSSASTLVKMPHCWKSHVAAQIEMTVSTALQNKDQTPNLYKSGAPKQSYCLNTRFNALPVPFMVFTFITTYK